MAKSIHETVMLGSLSISFPEMRRKAAKEAREIEVNNHAKAGTITAAKHLLAGVAKHKIAKDNVTQIRAWWSNVTVPWFDGKGAPRAVNSLAVTDLKVELGDRVRVLRGLWEDFLAEYPIYRAQRQFEMGALFDPSEFPTPQELERKFRVHIDWCALPKAADIRVMEGFDEKDVKEAIEREQQRIKHAQEVVAQRLFKVVKSMHDTMNTKIGEPGSKFNNTKLENILQVAELIPRINLTNDPKLAALAKEAKKLATKSPDELREDEVKRASAAKEAKTLADKLAGMFTATDDEDE